MSDKSQTTELCDDEGCPNHGTQHVCIVTVQTTKQFSSDPADHPDLVFGADGVVLNCAICGSREARPLFEGRTDMMLCEECLNAAFVAHGCNGSAENE